MSTFAAYDSDRIEVSMRKCIRNYKQMTVPEQEKANFLIEAEISSEFGDYSIAIDKSGYLREKGHPKEIAETLMRQSFRTRYDEELHTFQLRLEQWEEFKELFESVTGYKVDKVECPMSPFTVNLNNGNLKNRAAQMDEHVLGLTITKPNETISDRECSKGEKKIIKCFTTLLNKEIMPSVVLIDDVEMHVELSRHMALVGCIEKCFPNCQIVFTTHSPKIIHGFDIDRMIDLTVKSKIGQKTWRKELIRILTQSLFFPNESRNEECIGDMLKQLRTVEDLDKDWAKHVSAEAIFTINNQLLERIEKI